jgi:hypothetical protein
MGEPSASPGQATWLGWLPIPALILASDGSTVAVNPAWATVLPEASDGGRWLEAVEPPFRSALQARLRLAAAAGEHGHADFRVTGPHGSRWSRWWWHPAPPQSLVVCVAVIDDGPAGASPPVHADTPDLPAHAPARAAPHLKISTDHATAAIHRIFAAGLALQSAASLLDGPPALLVRHALDDLDQLVHHIRSAVFEQRTHPVTPPPHAAP